MGLASTAVLSVWHRYEQQRNAVTNVSLTVAFLATATQKKRRRKKRREKKKINVPIRIYP
jgi:hypothetical protein